MVQLKNGLAILTFTALGGTGLWMLKTHGGVVSSTLRSWKDLHHHLVELKGIDEQNHRLRLENENLRRWGEEVQFRCASDAARKSSKENASSIKAEAGNELARVLSGIQYTPPSHLLPKQLFVLGLAYFDQKDYEKSAVIMSYLTGLTRYPEFKTARGYLIAGISWYHLEHLRLSEDYFQKAISLPTEAAGATEKAQAKLWSALLAKKDASNVRSQKWLKELIDQHPFSKEAKWVNPAGRAPSSRKSH